MIELIAFSVLAVSTALATGALAQTPPPGPTVEQRAAAAAVAKAEGDALLRKANASDLFDNVSADGAIMLRHKASGFTCIMNPGKTPNQVTVFPGPVRGDDVGCTSETITDVRTMYITRSSHTVEEELAAAKAAMKVKYPRARETPAGRMRKPVMVLPADLGLPKHLTSVFETGRTSERVDVGIVDGWALKYRFTSAPNFGSAGVLDMFWPTAVLMQRRDKTGSLR